MSAQKQYVKGLKEGVNCMGFMCRPSQGHVSACFSAFYVNYLVQHVCKLIYYVCIYIIAYILYIIYRKLHFELFGSKAYVWLSLSKQ